MRCLMFFLVGAVATECFRLAYRSRRSLQRPGPRTGRHSPRGCGCGPDLRGRRGWVVVVIALTTVMPGRYPPLGVRSHLDVAWAPAVERAIGWRRTEVLSRSCLQERVKSLD